MKQEMKLPRPNTSQLVRFFLHSLLAMVPAFTLLAATFSVWDDQSVLEGAVRGLMWAVTHTVLFRIFRLPSPYRFAFPRLSAESKEKVINAYEGKSVELNKTEYEQLQKFAKTRATQITSPSSVWVMTGIGITISLILSVVIAFQKAWLVSGAWLSAVAVLLAIGFRGAKTARCKRTEAEQRANLLAELPIRPAAS